MIDHLMNDDALSLSMFWAGLLMVFTPLIAAGSVVFVVWRGRVKQRAAELQRMLGD
jgi:hypothetical protein